jgi:Ni/Co efflux regulator RcnB
MMAKKISTVAAALLAGGLLVSAVAQAQPGPRPDDRRPPPPPAHRHRAPPPPVMAGPQAPVVVGNRLPPAYRGYNYRVDNWNHYRLPRPRPGQFWVQYGAQFVLTTPAGVALQVYVP